MKKTARGFGRLLVAATVISAGAVGVAAGAAACGNDDDSSADAAADATGLDVAADRSVGASDATGAGDGSSADGSGADGALDDAAAADADAAAADAGRDTGVPAHFSPTTVACIGDSITQGVGASSGATDWVSDLAGLLGKGAAVGNFGVSGTTMLKVSDNPYWNTGDLAKAEAFGGANDAGAGAAVIIMLGTNDSKDVDGGVDNWNATAPARYRADYNSMLDALEATTPKPLVFLALPPPAFTNGYDIDGTVIAQQIIPIIVDIAYQRGLPIIDVHSALAGMSADFPDGVHPNDTGHALVARTMHDGLLSPHVPESADGG